MQEELFEKVVSVLTDYLGFKPRYDQDDTDDWRVFDIGSHAVQVNCFRANGRVMIEIRHNGTVSGVANDVFEEQILGVLRGQLGNDDYAKIKRITSSVHEHQIA